MTVVPLRCEGPLQSWGVTGRHKYRDTLRFPTLSGTVGMMASALGIGRNNTDALAALTERVAAMTVRIDRQGRLLEDYHTIGGGSHPVVLKHGTVGAGSQAGNSTMTVDDDTVTVAPYAAPRRSYSTAEGSTIVTTRAYLADASFLVLVRFSDDPSDVVAALLRPKWPPHLGRRTCAPSERIAVHLPQTWPTIADALNNVPTADRRDNQLRIVTDDPTITGTSEVRQTINDVPHSFAHKRRRYGTRTVRTFPHHTDTPVQHTTDAPFDAFAAATEEPTR